MSVQEWKPMITKKNRLSGTENEKFPKTVILINLKRNIQACKDISEES